MKAFSFAVREKFRVCSGGNFCLCGKGCQRWLSKGFADRSLLRREHQLADIRPHLDTRMQKGGDYGVPADLSSRSAAA
jgi:hypothetical protein